MEELIKHNEYIQSLGLSELNSWLMMLEDIQETLNDIYKIGDSDKINTLNKDIDFIQRQIVRLSQK